MRKAMVPADQEDRVAKVEEGEVVRFGTRDSHIGQHDAYVGPKCDQNNGRWYCATHRESFNNQFQKDIHIHSNKHRLAWMCFEHGIEVP
jgi:hypothetical protein